ncbi:hypothetical protein IFM89_011800, partial [Coptis chinensis]
FVIDGNKVILSASNPETKVDDAELEENEVYSVDIVTSTGDRLPEIKAWLSLGTKTKKKGDGKKKEVSSGMVVTKLEEIHCCSWAATDSINGEEMHFTFEFITEDVSSEW